MQRQRLIIGVSGSSAPQLGWATLHALHHHPDIETHLVISRGAEKTIQLEMGLGRSDFESLADVCYDPEDMGAAISSGSFHTVGMVVVLPLRRFSTASTPKRRAGTRRLVSRPPSVHSSGAPRFVSSHSPAGSCGVVRGPRGRLRRRSGLALPSRR